MNMQQIDTMAMRALIFEASVGVIVLILLFWATYWVIKAGVRDGIREAGSERRTYERPPAPAGFKWALIKEKAATEDMRAE
ncbi:MAG: hypothetical protein JSS77_16260 [Acidobacteria bacterium]|nr:hypothetical protein [Acidobacteriota bacterium]